MPIYQTHGTLTGTIPAEHLAAAQEYLTADDMTPYLHGYSDASAAPAVERIRWCLHGDGHRWTVEAITTRELTEAELKEISGWVSGQNSDGLGEGFEQQPFAEVYDPDAEDEDDGYAGMVSFDWETNDCTFERV